MSNRAHERALARARAKRKANRMQSRRQRNRIIAYVAIIAMAFAVVGAVALSGNDGGPDDAEPDAGLQPSSLSYDAAPELTIDESVTYEATISTTSGDIVVELNAATSPVTVNNFVTLARDGFYDGVPFHRVMEGFMIQGGDPTGTGTGGPGYQFEDELELAQEITQEHGGYPRGTLAMANSGPDTNGSQFFIVQGVPAGETWEPYPLPPQYAVFGEVTDGIEVVDSIAAEPVASDGQSPLEPVRITSLTVEER